jgi:hypothetical protein
MQWSFFSQRRYSGFKTLSKILSEGAGINYGGHGSEPLTIPIHQAFGFLDGFKLKHPT